MSDYNKINSLFISDTFYHIYNRGNNRGRIYFKEYNYSFFLKLFYKYTFKWIDTFAYCLLPNHFHFLIKTKSEINLDKNYKPDEINAPIREQFRKFLMRYSKAINSQESRIGSLFQKNFKRKPVLNDNHLKLLIAYIHTNPLYHSITKDFENYKWSSYKSIISSKLTKLKRNELLDFFDGRENFIEFHRSYCDYRDIKELIEID